MTLSAQVTLQTSSMDPADNNTNVFAADAVGGGVVELDLWIAAMKAFYDSIQGLGGLRGIAQNNHTVKIYDITLPQPNYPIYEKNFNLAAGASPVDMPMEVALCVSYKNTLLNSVARARRRGRIYISGWGETQNQVGRPVAAAYEGLATSYKTYADTVNGITGFEAGVWSRAGGVVYPIDTIWCDNEWDTQRRRGTKATARSTVLVA